MDIKDRVLVIEDDKSIRNFFRTVLEANNYDVLIATTGAEGYSMVTSQCPDVVILDLGLPDMDGMSILKNVRQWSSMPVLVVSARTHEKDKVAALDAGADDYITKPFGTSELLGKYAGKVLTYDFIIKEIWGPNMQNDNRILRVNMANIRRKMENNPAQPQYIFTEVGVGYRIVDGD